MSTHIDENAVLVVGSGLAAWSLVREFRKLDRERPLMLISREAGDYYAKPMLSTALAQGKSPEALVNTPAVASVNDLGCFTPTRCGG